MNEQFFACFYLLWTRTDCRLIMNEKPTLMAVNRWQVCCCASGGCATRIRERNEWDPTPKRRSIHSPFSGSLGPVDFQSIDVIFTLPFLYFEWCIRQNT
jgi:hypothetical protein